VGGDDDLARGGVGGAERGGGGGAEGENGEGEKSVEFHDGERIAEVRAGGLDANQGVSIFAGEANAGEGAARTAEAREAAASSSPPESPARWWTISPSALSTVTRLEWANWPSASSLYFTPSRAASS